MAKNKRRTYQKKTPEQVKEEIKKLTDGMEKRISNHFHSSDQLKEYLDFMGKFYRYSPRNTALIDSQFPGPKLLARLPFGKKKASLSTKEKKG
ncbi:hypothetical protein MUO14_09145 [Halobacillus shinanisalinarum]|uniref:Uncharacterized protein n=1 Tax=Halobacillus shinanisalinarum TaxID=2932258 RepID=A0ABY4H657_9BACI|nr:hypothetical protein [Halobacillus shinanisalinarum]UOQ95072.1 hypothetical protein MUO14_09145 [Halobacillus shinanisalinarum]